MKIILIGSLLFVSCSTLHTAKPIANQIPLTNDNVSQLNGDYEIFPDSTEKASLDQALLFNMYWWKDFENRKNYSLTLKAIDKDRLQVDIYKSGGWVNSKNIKYKIKEGAVLIKRKMIKPYVIINAYGTMHTRLRLITSGELVIDHHSSAVGGFLLLPTAGKNVTEEGTVYKKRR